MASAILARRNEPQPHWPETQVYMRKPHPASRIRYNNPDPEFDAPPPPEVAVSDDESSFSRRAPDRSAVSDGYVVYKISTYTKLQLRELKRKIESELDHVRSVVSKIESREIQNSGVGHGASGIYAAATGGPREVTSSSSFRANPASNKALAGIMSKCKQILGKLLKQKGITWFNVPVDVKKLNLHDYYQIVKRPMDLGTVRSNLNKGLYASPMEFAADVRLTFDNALLYNPKGHIVHDLAGKFLRNFNNEFDPAYQRYERQLADIVREEDERQRMATWSRAPSPRVYRVPDFSPPRRLASPSPVPQVSPPRRVATPVQDPEPEPDPEPAHSMQQHQMMMAGKPRLPKPKARDLHKRVMSIEEKERLSEGLQSLPQEKMEQVLQIVRKRSGELVQDGDEIELDFEAMDTETLWELDRFVYNCRKMMSKMRRQEAMTTDVTSAPPSTSAPAEDADQLQPAADEAPNHTTTAAKSIKRTDMGDDEVVDIGGDDVDIGGDDEITERHYPAVEIEKDNASSGSDSSSSSSGSDSDSSSGSDSDDGGEVRSPAVASRSSP